MPKAKTKHKAGDVVSIYTDFQDEDPSTYLGEAILIEKVRDGDSFYLKDEEVIVREKRIYTKSEEQAIVKYNALKRFFDGDKPDKTDTEKKRKTRNGSLKIKLALTVERKDLIDDDERMRKVIDSFLAKKQFKSMTEELLSRFDFDYIVRYIQQDRPNWRPTIYKSERWLVRFIKDKEGWDVDYTTHRNIRLISCINPSESIRDSDIRRFTTYNGKSSNKRHVDSLIDDEDEEEDYEDEQHDNNIKLTMDKWNDDEFSHNNAC